MTQPTSNNNPLPIVDSLDPVTNQLVDQAKNFLGHTPVAWGRYFTTQYPGEYSHAKENSILHSNNIKLLPIARHTNHVGKSHAQGVADAIQGVNDLFATFSIDYWRSQGSEFFYFLDVEPSNPLSEEYYKGWSETLISESKSQSGNHVTILPCVYANFHDGVTLPILVKEDVSCHGLWIARYPDHPKKNPSWGEKINPIPPIIQHSSIPVFLRQYARGAQINQKFDLDQTNPHIADIQGEFLDKLILPPANS